MLLVPPLTLTLILAHSAAALQIPFLRPSPPHLLPTSSATSTHSPEAEDLLTLRHVLHHPTRHPHLPPSRKDYSPTDLNLFTSNDSFFPLSSLDHLKRRTIRAHRPSSQEAFQAARRASYFTPLRAFKERRLPTEQEQRDRELAGTLEWEEVEIEAPDTRDVGTLAALGKMTSNAYTTEDGGGWYDLGEEGWNVVRLESSLPTTCSSLT